MGFTALAAMATAGGAAAAGVATFTAMSYVGMAMTIIGAVTKNEKLMKTGGMLSMVGGIGGAVSSPGGLAQGASGEVALEGAEKAATDAATGAAAEGAAGAAQSTAGATGGSSAAAGMSATPTAGLEGGLAQPTISSPTVSMTQPATAASGPAGAMPVGADVMPVGGKAVEAGVAGAAAPTTPMDIYPGEAITQGAGKVSSDSFFSGFFKNPQLIQLAGGAFKGAAERDMFDERMDLARQELALRSHGNSTPKYTRVGIVNSARN
jgi:hypothetical protein